MIPRTFPSSRASNGSTQMIVYFLPSVSGLTRWVDYIPVKFTTVATAATENTYNQNGYIPVVSISSIAGATPFKEYVPVFLDSSAADAEVWKVNVTGFIPVGTAGIGGAALYMDFAATTTLDPRVTFSRTTNATLTNSAGLVANAPMNLLTFSEQFDNAAWTKTRTTITANAIAAPDGSVTADKLIASTDNNTHFLTRSLAVTGLHNLSGYFKAAEYSQVYLGDGSGTSKSVTVNLLTGAVVSSGGSASNVSVTAAGNGWFRISLAVTDAIGYTVFLLDSGGGLTFAGNGTSGIYIWGAQLELGSTATTYNPTTVKNLLGFTEHFDNAAWTKSNATITSGFTDIYGQPFAQKLNATTATGDHTAFAFPSSFVAGAPYVFSYYAKAAEYTKTGIRIGGAGYATTPLAVVDLTNGSILSQQGFTSLTVQSVGSGWYRVSGGLVSGTGLTPNIQPLSDSYSIVAGNFSYTGDGTSGIYIFGAQLSDSASVDPYVYQPVAAPTSTAYYGPRFDYDPVTLAPKGLLIEEQRSNLLLNSAALGTQAVTVAATAHTLSFYGTGTIVLSGASTGTVVGTGAYPTRTTLTFTPTMGVLTVTVTGSVTMAQLEAGAFATSYIPTAASQVTRAADSASMIGNNFARWYNVNEGTLFTDYSSVASGIRTIVAINDGTANESIRLRTDTTNPLFTVTDNGVDQANIDAGTVASNTAYKFSGSYALNNFISSIAGGTAVVDTSGTLPTVNRAMLGNSSANNYLNGTLKRFAFYSRPLTASEQQGITA